MKIAYIMRAVPGSGKSTIAKILAGTMGVIHSTDEYFMVDGEYRFDPTLLGRYHDENFAAFCRSMGAGVPIVICDNTNSAHWHYERYAEAASKAGYKVVYVVIPHPTPEVTASRTIHNVPAHTIQRMIDEWEY